MSWAFPRWMKRRTDMLSNTGFDLWADGYDKSVGLSDENGRYPFVGYRAMMNAL